MNLSFLPLNIINALNSVDLNKLNEIRLRVGYPISIKVNFDRYYLSESGMTTNYGQGILCSSEHVNHVIHSVTEKSIYAHNDKIKNGYITDGQGVRIGIAGECVKDGESILTIKNVTSLNVRIPHEIIGCSNKLYDIIYKKNIQILNTLIISPPSIGKTTILKDLARNFNNNTLLSILIIDERGEFSSVSGANIDSIKYSDKLYAFEFGLRSLSPNVIITDELCTRSDWLCVKKAKDSGINVIASCHSDSVDNLINKKDFIHDLFDMYVLLDCKKPGTIKYIYKKDFSIL